MMMQKWHTEYFHSKTKWDKSTIPNCVCLLITIPWKRVFEENKLLKKRNKHVHTSVEFTPKFLSSKFYVML